MLKLLHINRDSECSGLLLCNHLNPQYKSTYCILLRDLLAINIGVGWRLQEFAILRSVNSDLKIFQRGVLHFVNSYKKMAQRIL